MNFISATKTGDNSAEIKFSIDQEKFSAEVTRVYKKRAPKITIPASAPQGAPAHHRENVRQGRFL